MKVNLNIVDLLIFKNSWMLMSSAKTIRCWSLVSTNEDKFQYRWLIYIQNFMSTYELQKNDPLISGSISISVLSCRFNICFILLKIVHKNLLFNLRFFARNLLGDRCRRNIFNISFRWSCMNCGSNVDLHLTSQRTTAVPNILYVRNKYERL